MAAVIAGLLFYWKRRPSSVGFERLDESTGSHLSNFFRIDEDEAYSAGVRPGSVMFRNPMAVNNDSSTLQEQPRSPPKQNTDRNNPYNILDETDGGL